MSKTKKICIIAAVVLAIAIAAGAGIILYRNSPSSVIIYTAAEKTEYNYGDTLDTAGLSLLVTYHSGRKEVVSQNITCTPMELTQSGSVEITADYRGKTATFSVESTPVLTGIRIGTAPENTWYAAGSTLDTTGLTLEASFNDGSTREITEGFTCSPEQLTEPGTPEISVAYEGHTATFPVEVVGISKFSVLSKSARDAYLVGETPDEQGAVLNVTYTDGSTAVIKEGYTVSGDPFTEPGTSQYTIFYGGLEQSYPVEVFPAVEFEEFDFFGTGIYNDSGPGKNYNGDILTWALYIEFNFPEELMNVIMPEVSCSWTQAINDTPSSLESIFGAAKKGATYVEFCPFPAEYTPNGKHRLDVFLYLPDDPAIAGEQYVTLRMGQTILTVYFTLEYSGDYGTGSGWIVDNIRY